MPLPKEQSHEPEPVFAEDVITNYYTGEKLYLVNLDGNYTYVNAARYKLLKGTYPRVSPKV